MPKSLGRITALLRSQPQRWRTTTATTQPSWPPPRMWRHARPPVETGSPRTSTDVPSASVVITGAAVDGPVRTFAPAPSVAAMTKPGTGEGDGAGVLGSPPFALCGPEMVG